MKKVKLVLLALLGLVCIICVLAAFFPRPKLYILPPEPPDRFWKGAQFSGSYSINIEPVTSLVDQPIHLRVMGLQPGQPILLRARMFTSQGLGLESFAAFQAESDGSLDIDRAAPLYGTYSGVDGMGLFWSMLPVKMSSPQENINEDENRNTMLVHLTLEAHGQVLAAQDVTRSFVAEHVAHISLDEQGMLGSLYYPDDGQPHPVVIYLGGSEGGLSEGMSALLASHGYTSLSLAYFGIEPLPSALVEIPLEYFARSIDWLGTQPAADTSHLAVLGGSKGAELALLLGATYPQDIHAVIAIKPSSHVWMGIYTNPSQYSQGSKSSWTLGGEDVPYAIGALTWDMIGLLTGRQTAMRSSYEKGLKDGSADAGVIQVEKINGPVLLISGGDDQMWPSADMAETIIARLKANQHPFDDQSLVYPQAGHSIFLPYLPGLVADGNLLLGGTQEANAHASLEAWPVILAFLNTSLSTPVGQ